LRKEFILRRLKKKMGIFSKAKIKSEPEHWDLVIAPNPHLLELKWCVWHIGCGGKF